eukprot:jgi/Ulvmu1/4352/UM002_0077.1
MQSSCCGGTAPLKRSVPFTELTEHSDSDQLLVWLRNILGEDKLSSLVLDDVESSDVLACENAEELEVLFSASEHVAELIAEQVFGQKRLKTGGSDFEMEGTAENCDPNNEPEGKPDPTKLKVDAHGKAADCLGTAPDGLANADMDAEDLPTNQDRDAIAAVEMTKPDETSEEDASEDDETDNGGDEMREDEGENVVDDEPEEDIDTAPDHSDCVILSPVTLVFLPEDKEVAICYVEKAMIGFGCFLEDMSMGCCTIVAKGLGMKAPRKNHKKDQVRQVRNVLGFLDAQVTATLQDKQWWKPRLEGLLNKIKSSMHDVLSTGNVQQKSCFTNFILRVIPYNVKPVETVTDAGDGSDDKKTKRKDVAEIDEFVLERLWAIWQDFPLFGTIKCPVQVRVKKNEIVSVSKASMWTGPTLYSIFSEQKRMPRLRAPVGNQANEASNSVMTIMRQILWHRHGRTNLKIRNGTLLAICQRVRDPEYDADQYEGYQMTFKFFLEAGQVSIEREKGMSSFVRMIEDSEYSAIHVLELTQHCEEFKGTSIASQSKEFSHEYEQIVDALQDVNNDKEPHAHDPSSGSPVRSIANSPVEGSLFKKLLGMVSNMDNEVPGDLQELLLPHLKHALYDHQLASLNFVRKEESAEEGLQRHYWWRVKLPSDPTLVCFVSPHFNAVWWATNADHLHCWDFANKKHIDGICPIRCSQGFKLTGSKSKGGMLALDMGMGKTPVMLAAHSLEQHLIPLEPERHTHWTDAELKLHRTVLVGKDEETQKEFEMYTGFKQADDPKRSIVPDGTVRFTGRGNLVVAPRTLLGQWSSMISEHTKQDHSVCVLEGIKERREFMTSVEGLKRLASYDWVIMSPGIVPKDIDMLRVIDWRRVIADEAHQLSGSCTVAMGINKAQRETSLMHMLASIPAVQGHWCLTGTPLRSYRQVGSLDRIFCALSTGIGTSEHLHNATLVLFVSSVAIRYDKQGFIKGKACLKLPPLYDEVRRVNLTEEDREVQRMVRGRLVKDSDKVEYSWVLHKQAEYVNGPTVEVFEEEEEDDDEDYASKKQGRKKSHQAAQKEKTYPILRDVVDPLRWQQ